MEAPPPPADYEVWEDHWDSLLMFLRCQTQWRVGGSGVVGLDYNVLLGFLPHYAVHDPARLIEDIRVMESRAVQLFNEQAAKAQKEQDRKRPRRGGR
jgi:hypothetical protein